MTSSEGKSQNAERTREIASAVESFFNDFVKESDRAVVVVGAAKLDILLRQLLQRFLIPSTSSSDELLDTERPLGTFSARILACYRLGLIDAEMTRALHLLRRIRNEFAHETSAVTLSSGTHADRIRDLVAPLKTLASFKGIYELEALSHVTGPAKDFRVALALLCGRLEFAVRRVQVISDEKKTVLIPQNWREMK